MSCLYITENGSKVAVKGGHFNVECQDGSEPPCSERNA